MSPTAPLPLTHDEELKLLQDLRQLVKECGDQVVQDSCRAVDDDLLLILIRCRHYKVKSAFDRIKRLAYARLKYPKDLDTLYPSRVAHLKDVEGLRNGLSILKNRDSTGKRVVIIRPRFWDPEEISLEDLQTAGAVIALELMQSIETQLNGAVGILDAQGYSLKHAKLVTPYNIHKYAFVLSRANPAKMRGGHIINAPRLFNKAYSVVKMFLPKKIRNRIYAHNSLESLHECISPDILPKWLGGKLSDEEAIDNEIIEELFTSKEKDDYYRDIIDKFNNRIKS